MGGGCFWCLEAAFNEVPETNAVELGNSGGSAANSSRDHVCSALDWFKQMIEQGRAEDEIAGIYEVILGASPGLLASRPGSDGLEATATQNTEEQHRHCSIAADTLGVHHADDYPTWKFQIGLDQRVLG